MLDDFELLREHVERGSEEAFRTLVERHSGMVHGVATRIVRDAHRAEEVTQAVFIILARKAASLRRGTVLGGWLYRTARYVALEALRSEKRLQRSRQTFSQMNESTPAPSIWNQIAPLLEEVMSRLNTTDRDAVVLRFFEERSFAEIAGALGTSEAAAKMRVGRALEKLRSALMRHGVALPAAALATALSTNGASAAPAGLSNAVAAIALAHTNPIGVSLSPLVSAGLKILAWNKMKASAIVAAIACLLVGSAFWVERSLSESANRPVVGVTGFVPMAGEWEGTFEMRGDDLPRPTRQTAALTIRSDAQGRACEIEMRLHDLSGRVAAVHRFQHTLNAAGNRVTTIDDPQIGRATGEGSVIESHHDPSRGEWRVAFRITTTNPRSSTVCRWIQIGDRLAINRHDEVTTEQGKRHLFSDLELRRKT